MSDTGNAAQVRAVGLQLFEVWKSEQAELGEKRRASWPAWLGVVLAGVALVFSAGSLRSEVAATTAKVSELKERVDAQDVAAKQVTDRLARIETKLDLALENQKGGK